MKKSSILATTAVALLFTACATVPITGRKQMNLVSNSEVLASSLTQYQTYMSKATPIRGTQAAAMVERVGKKIAAATESYLRQNGMESELKNYNWEFNLVKDDNANAFCMPGGKIVVYEGLLKYVKTDDDLAVVMGHEVAHAVAKHSNERMSQQMLAQYGGTALGLALGGSSQATQAIASQVYGLGAQYGVMLPFSRKHEKEADYMGLVLMSIAGYNPQASTQFWQRMSEGGSNATPEFMSTHPSDATRISALQKALPEVEEKYAPRVSLPIAQPATSTPKKSTSTAKKKTSKTTRK
ncbi:MAG: M48 family metallopeptidase [Bacteroidales bacterium]|nr:M48 family metallopeptidase [Bacteroidales bacterium]